MTHCFDLWIQKMHTRSYSPSSFCTFLWNFNLIPREKVMKIFARSPVWNVIQESAKRPTSSDHNSTNIVQKALKFGSKVQRDLFWNIFFYDFWNVTEKIYSENATMTCLEQRNPRIQSSDTKCYETSSRKDKKYRSMPSNSASLRGKPPLHYINE